MSTKNNPSDYSVVWPKSPRTVKMSPVAPRVESLKGKTIAQLWDYIFRGDEIFPILEEEIGRRFPGAKFVSYNVFGSTHGGDEREVVAALPEKLKAHHVDAVISGMGC